MRTFLFTLFLFPICLRAQIVTTVVGTGIAGYAGDNAPAIAAQLKRPVSIAFDTAGNMYIAEAGNNRIRKVNTAGIITTIAGTGTAAWAGDNGPATAANIEPVSIATDSAGNVYIAEVARIRKIDAAGIITTIAGVGIAGFNTDSIPATGARINNPHLGFVDATGALFFADSYNHRIRKIDASGTITTVVGIGISGSAGDGGPATAANLGTPFFLSRNANNELLIPDMGARRVRKVDVAGIIDAFAGTGGGGNGGDGGPAVTATVGTCIGAACDDSGNVYVTSTGTNTVRKVDASGIITRIAGTGTMSYSGDNGPALLAEFNYVNQVVIHKGDIYVVDMYNNRIRKIATGTVGVTTTNYSPGNISLYPNPATDNLTIQAGTVINNVVVTDIAGRAVASYGNTVTPSNQINISLKNVPPGLYQVSVNDVHAGQFIKE